MGERVRITDVAPRDGLQNEPGVIATSDKVRLVELLAATGVDEIEVSSFVSPRWVPQLADASDVFAGLTAAPSSGPAAGGAGRAPLLSALVPNEQGVRAALAVNERAGRRLIGKVGVFTAASETFSHRNTNASIAETIRRFEPAIGLAHASGLEVRGYISCVVRCPFEGAIQPGRVGHVAQALADAGVDEIDLGDTIGASEPESIHALIHALAGRLGDDVVGRLTLHLHDTFGRAAECVREALQLGVRSFDGSAAGLGGCPYAGTPERRAPGNIGTELLVRTVERAGYTTGVDPEHLGEAAAFAMRIVGAARGAASAGQRPAP